VKSGTKVEEKQTIFPIKSTDVKSSSLIKFSNGIKMFAIKQKYFVRHEIKIERSGVLKRTIPTSRVKSLNYSLN